MGEVGKGEEYIQLGRLYLKEGKPEEAHYCFEKAFARVEKNSDVIPLDLISFYGYTLAYVQGEIEEGLQLCRKVVSRGEPKGDHFLNLGRVYLLRGQKPKAIKTFYQGLQMEPRHTGILVELKRLGKRRRPLLSLFSRHHFLNRYFGVILRKNPSGFRY
ncbi:MAG TPA: tetratricopeptide repeat protein [Nitrospiria bacterium]|jgi:tetratricopeptide (TPR) repeat protein